MSSFVKFFLLESSQDDSLKYALVPFDQFPPHKGHYAFIKHYSDLIGQDGKVVVFLAKKKYLKELMSEYVSDLPNVIISVASVSPMDSVKNFGQEALKFSNSATIVLACSGGSKAIHQMEQVKAYYASQYPDCYVIDPKTTTCDNDGSVSDNLFIRALSDKNEVVKYLPDHLNKEQQTKVVSILTNLS